MRLFQRKDRDSNPGTRQAGQRFSRPPHSTTLASFHEKQRITKIFHLISSLFSECKDTNFFVHASFFLIIDQISPFLLIKHITYREGFVHGGSYSHSRDIQTDKSTQKFYFKINS